MTFFDTLFGRTKPKAANLDALFALPTAAITLEAAAGLKPSGHAAVCFKPASGEAFVETGRELESLLELAAKESGIDLRQSDDRYGYRWIILTIPEVSGLVTTAHLVNATLQDHGFGPQLLCSVFEFRSVVEQSRCYLVYLYKRGTFYPFAPLEGERRDSEFELRLRGILASDLPLEEDLTRWFPLWGIPLS